MWMLVFLFLLVLIVLLAMKIKNNLNDKCKWVRVMSFGVCVSSGWSGSRSHGTVSWRTQHASAHALIAQDSHTIFYIFLTIIADREKQNSLQPWSASTVHSLRCLIFNPPFTLHSIQFIEDAFYVHSYTVNHLHKPDNFDLPYKYLIVTHHIIFRDIMTLNGAIIFIYYTYFKWWSGCNIILLHRPIILQGL